MVSSRLICWSWTSLVNDQQKHENGHQSLPCRMYKMSVLQSQVQTEIMKMLITLNEENKDWHVSQPFHIDDKCWIALEPESIGSMSESGRPGWRPHHATSDSEVMVGWNQPLNTLATNWLTTWRTPPGDVLQIVPTWLQHWPCQHRCFFFLSGLVLEFEVGLVDWKDSSWLNKYFPATTTVDSIFV